MARESLSNKDIPYISVDIESSGPIPGEYSMLSLGACPVYFPEKKFYVEFKPISSKADHEALKVTGFSLDQLRESGVTPEIGMGEFATWLKETYDTNYPIFVAFNATFDWSFVNYYFHRFIGGNPFGISGIDIKAYYMGKFGTSWRQTTKSRINPRFLSKSPHTHNALDDAVEQADIFRKILEYPSNTLPHH